VLHWVNKLDIFSRFRNENSNTVYLTAESHHMEIILDSSDKFTLKIISQKVSITVLVVHEVLTKLLENSIATMKWSRISSVCRMNNPVLSSFMTDHRVCNHPVLSSFMTDDRVCNHPVLSSFMTDHRICNHSVLSSFTTDGILDLRFLIIPVVS
jgi:hypothetical protein